MAMAVAEAYNIGSELTVTIRMSRINSERSDQWTRTVICPSRSMSAWDFFAEPDTLRSRRPHKITKLADKTLEMAGSPFS
jgi:hypothetical protein